MLSYAIGRLPRQDLSFAEIRRRTSTNPIVTARKAGLTEKDFQRYRTRRRRIRSYFGSEENLARVALTIDSERHIRGQISGFFLAIAGNHGKKGIRASEGYTLCKTTEHSGIT